MTTQQDNIHGGLGRSVWQIRRFTPEMGNMWNDMVALSRNGTFLFDRRFMDYHSDRFEDYSLIGYRNGNPEVLLPANITSDGVLHSHQGLTYGGWLTPRRHFDGTDMLNLFYEWIRWGRQEGLSEFDYKSVPFIYWSLPAGEDEYALWRFGAEISAVNLSSAFELSDRPPFEQRQRRNLKKALKSGVLEVCQTFEADRFIDFVNLCLTERHDALAVHTGEELARLINTFPDRIQLWVASRPGTGNWEAGVCIFNTGRVAHSQYIATSPEGRQNGVLSYLFEQLFSIYSGTRWFDFGTSNELNGRVLNNGLLLQKTELGGRGIPYSRFRLRL